MGTPDFARTILERLVADGHDVCGVFTQPDKPRNRNKVTPSSVKEYALSQNIPVFQPVTMRDGTALEDFKTLAPELAVVAAYGRILPEEMLAVPVHGCINAHASILPKYRGAAPINRAILDGEKETGVTVMHMAKECDGGDMILVKKPSKPILLLPLKRLSISCVSTVRASTLSTLVVLSDGSSMLVTLITAVLSPLTSILAETRPV